MSVYAGIDLGTTNSAICTWDGATLRTWKSPEQSDVTPSVIYMDRRGNKFYGHRAFQMAASSPDNAALLFKRFMGTKTPITLAGTTMTPEQASAEILKVLYGYLPDEIRSLPDTGAVITVPAAFNQMQKDATVQAAEMAGIGRVALMQEPVAAVMSIMRERKTDGIFMVFDLGGGTLDVAIAESDRGKVTLLADGGVPMLGGRDFDRALVDNVIKPWLIDQFDLPDGFAADPEYRRLVRLAAWAAEKAKIELSSRDQVVISLSEAEVRLRDRSGQDIYLEAPLERATFDELIGERLDAALASARETVSKAGLHLEDIERIVFIGGPTWYAPLREKVSRELGITGALDVNPMTAVADGAAIFAEAIDWGSENHARKSLKGQLTSAEELGLSFVFQARTPDSKARIAAQIKGSTPPGFEFQIDSMTTGWTSGRVPLREGAMVDVPLPQLGEHTFRVFVFSANGQAVRPKQERLVITRTAASVDAIPASKSMGIEVLDRIGGKPTLRWIVRAGDQLPRKGEVRLKAGQVLKAGSGDSLRFNVWEGEIEEPISDNEFVGTFKIRGSDFAGAVIPAGAGLEFRYEVLDSGQLRCEVSVPSIAATFLSDRNYYSREEGLRDYSQVSAEVVEEAEALVTRITEISGQVDDPELTTAMQRAYEVATLNIGEADAEEIKQAHDAIREIKGVLNGVRKRHAKEVREIDLQNEVRRFNDIRPLATQNEISEFAKLEVTARRAIGKSDGDFEAALHDMSGLAIGILWRQDDFVISFFHMQMESPWRYPDQALFRRLAAEGTFLLQIGDIDGLRNVVLQLAGRQERVQTLADVVNVIRG